MTLVRGSVRFRTTSTSVASKGNSGTSCQPAVGDAFPLNGDVERSLPVDETRDVSIQPFLLIGRTCRIVTAHDGKLTAASDVASSAGYSAFPAFGRI